MPIQYFRQKNDYYCGPACLKMVLSHFGINKSQDTLAKIAKTNNRTGTTKNNLLRTLRYAGVRAQQKSNLTISQLRILIKRYLCIVNYPELDENINHYAVVVAFRNRNIILHDPWHGKKYRIPITTFARRWESRTYKKIYSAWAVIIPKDQIKKS